MNDPVQTNEKWLRVIVAFLVTNEGGKVMIDKSLLNKMEGKNILVFEETYKDKPVITVMCV